MLFYSKASPVTTQAPSRLGASDLASVRVSIVQPQSEICASLFDQLSQAIII
jgi:hypothetical protein